MNDEPLIGDVQGDASRMEPNAVTIDASAGGDYLSPMPKRNQPTRESCVSDLKANALDEKYSSKPST